MIYKRSMVYPAFAVAVTIAMGLAIRNGFVYDDIPAIVQNARVTNPALWHTIPRSPYWLGTLWRPLTVAGYALQWYASNGAAWLFHLVSLLGYFAVGAALFRFAGTLGVASRIAAVMTLLFLVHPLHVEAVANVVGQAELWVALSLITSTTIYLRARRENRERQNVWWLLISVALGIWSKEQGFVIPLLLVGAEWLLVQKRDESLRQRAQLILPVLGLAILLFVVRGVLLNDNVGETPAVALRNLGFVARATTMLGVVPEWARLFLWPIHLQGDYGPPGIPIGGPMLLRHWIGLVMLVVVIATFAWSVKRAPVAAFGLWWLAIAIAPVSNLVTATGIVMAERVLFVPSIGVAIAFAGIAGVFAVQTTRRLVVETLAVAWGLMLTARSITRVPTWSSADRFFNDLTIDGAQAYRGWKVSAEHWEETHQHDRAITELTHAAALWPHDYEVFERLGQLYRQDGHCDKAVPIFQQGVIADPTASSLRAKLVECQLTLRDFDGAESTANDGVRLGLDEFKSMQVRVQKMREKN